jgi:hypothetical protein
VIVAGRTPSLWSVNVKCGLPPRSAEPQLSGVADNLGTMVPDEVANATTATRNAAANTINVPQRRERWRGTNASTSARSEASTGSERLGAP